MLIFPTAFIEEATQDTLLFHFLRVIVNQIFHRRGFFLMLVDEELNKDMAGMASTTGFASRCDRINVLQFAFCYGIADGALSDLIALTDDFVDFNTGRKIHEFKALKPFG